MSPVAVGLFALTALGCGGDSHLTSYECRDFEQSADFSRERSADGTLVDETMDLRCTLRTCEEVPVDIAIDITSGSVSVEGELLVVEIGLLDFPTDLPFNQSAVDSSLNEYWWSVAVDTDGDGFDDFRLAATRSRARDGMGEQENLRGDPLEFIRSEVLVANETSLSPVDAAVEAERFDGGIRFVVARTEHDVLRSVDSDASVSFEAIQAGNGWMCRDRL